MRDCVYAHARAKVLKLQLRQLGWPVDHVVKLELPRTLISEYLPLNLSMCTIILSTSIHIPTICTLIPSICTLLRSIGTDVLSSRTLIPTLTPITNYIVTLSSWSTTSLGLICRARRAALHAACDGGRTPLVLFAKPAQRTARNSSVRRGRTCPPHPPCADDQRCARARAILRVLASASACVSECVSGGPAVAVGTLGPVSVSPNGGRPSAVLGYSDQ